MDGARGAQTVPPSPRERERTVEVLCTHFARDHLSLQELERRLDEAYAVSSRRELTALTSDLPPLRPAGQAEEAVERALEVTVNPGLPIRSRETVMAVMGGVERTGRWTPARRLTAVAVMGGVELDFREAEFGTDVLEVTALAVMGGVEITVPPGVRLEVGGVAILGGFERMSVGLEPDPDAPLVRVGGLALMGGVEVKVRLPGETEKEARRRLKKAGRGG